MRSLRDAGRVDGAGGFRVAAAARSDFAAPERAASTARAHPLAPVTAAKGTRRTAREMASDDDASPAV